MGSPRVTSETDAANLALARVGASPIVSLDDASKRARFAARAFGPTRDALLRRHPWNFALVTFQPVEQPDVTPGRFSRGWLIPEEIVTIWDVLGLGADQWEMASQDGATTGYRLLMCDADAPQVRAARRRDPAYWDPLFVDVFASLLAAELAPALKGEGGEALREAAEARLLFAKRADSREAASGQVTRDTSWVAARRAWP